MIEKISKREICFDTLPFLRDVLLFAISFVNLPPEEILELARKNQQNTQEAVDCLTLSKVVDSNRVVQCIDNNSTHAIAINEQDEIMDTTFGLNTFLKHEQEVIIGDNRFEYSDFSFKIYKKDELIARKVYTNFSSPLTDLVDYQLTAENFMQSDFLGSMWAIEKGKMLGFIDIKGSFLKISFSDKKYKFNILEIQEYEYIENILDEFFIAINGYQYSKTSLMQLKINLRLIIKNFYSLKKIRPDIF